MIQRISTDADCGFLTFLNDGKEDKIYPPLRVYQDKHFLFVDGKDSHKISISKNKFKVYIDSVLYTDISEAEAELDTAAQCVNQSAEATPLDPDAARKTQQLLQITEVEETNDLLSEKTKGAFVNLSDIESGVTPAFPFDISNLVFDGTASGQGIEGVAAVATVANMDELVLLWNSNMTSIVLSKKTETSFYLAPGTKEIPRINPDNISFNNALTFRVYRASILKPTYLSLNENKSNIDVANETLDTMRFNKDFLQQVAEGLISGYSIINKYGHNDGLDDELSVISNTGLYQMPIAAAALEIVSDSPSDGIGGVGARVVRVIGLDADFNEIEQDIIMTGVAAVAIPIPLIRFYRAYALESGTYGSLTASSHVGTITIQGLGAGVAWGTINGVTTKPHAQTQIGAYTVPRGKTAYILNALITAEVNKVVNVLFYAREGANIVTAPYTALRLKSELRGVEGSRPLTLKSPRAFPEMTDIIWLASVAVGVANAGVEFEILLVDNEI